MCMQQLGNLVEHDRNRGCEHVGAQPPVYHHPRACSHALCPGQRPGLTPCQCARAQLPPPTAHPGTGMNSAPSAPQGREQGEQHGAAAVQASPATGAGCKRGQRVGVPPQVGDARDAARAAAAPPLLSSLLLPRRYHLLWQAHGWLGQRGRLGWVAGAAQRRGCRQRPQAGRRRRGAALRSRVCRCRRCCCWLVRGQCPVGGGPGSSHSAEGRACSGTGAAACCRLARLHLGEESTGSLDRAPWRGFGRAEQWRGHLRTESGPRPAANSPVDAVQALIARLQAVGDRTSCFGGGRHLGKGPASTEARRGPVGPWSQSGVREQIVTLRIEWNERLGGEPRRAGRAVPTWRCLRLCAAWGALITLARCCWINRARPSTLPPPVPTAPPPPDTSPSRHGVPRR